MGKVFDLAIIGGGPAGYVAAERAGAEGLSVIIFDERALGGVCLNEGCIPTKTLLHSAKLYQESTSAHKYGVVCDSVAFDFGKVMKRKNKMIRKLIAGVNAKMKHAKAEVIMARAEIKERRSGVLTIKAGEDNYNATHLLVCTGSEAMLPPLPGIDSEVVVTNREILSLTTPPERLTIIGGGVIGIEFANFFSAIGTKVSVIEMLPEILTGTDEDICEMLRATLKKQGVEFHLGAKVTKIENGNEVVYETGDKEERVAGDKILVSVGRVPNVKDIGLDNIGVEFSSKGIKIDKHCCTNIPNVYAAGDITGFSLLAHTASREGEVAVNNIIGKRDHMRYNAIPGVVYGHPEVASVGLTEIAAKKQGIDAITKVLPMAYSGRFMIENEGEGGLCKIVIGKKYGEVLGVHMIGGACSEIIWGACALVEAELRVTDVREIVFPHPTVSEIVREAVFH